MDNGRVKKVIVVSKTHLDVGFTDYAQSVLDQYVNSFIPRAVELAFQVNTPEHKRFVWTVGSYLVKYYLEHAQESPKQRFIEALKRSYVRWHALPLTTHTELMSAQLFDYGLSIGKTLDDRFGMVTIAAKMTDVPGHTAAMIPALAEAGIRYLHLGVNTSSRVPNVPALFRWRYGDREIAVSYTGGYGEATVLDTGIALEFLHTLDNSGPPTQKDLDAFYREMEHKYPNAQIEAGSLDDFAAELDAVWESLPTVEEEIGDTWIHGVATDPLKTSRLRRLLAMADDWLAQGRLQRGSEAYDSFMEQLLLVTEHTWGMDVKKHLLDFSNWGKGDFTRALNRDETDYSCYGERNRHILEAVREELRTYRGDNDRSSYTHFTRSHAEQRAYIDRALEALPEDCRNEAKEALAFAFPEQGITAVECAIGQDISVGAWTVRLGLDGSLTHVQNHALHLDRAVSIGRFEYQSFDGRAVDDCFFAYGRDLDRNYAWAGCDFGKPGLRYEPSVKAGLWTAVLRRAELTGDRLLVFLAADPEAADSFGCPRELAIEYRFLPEHIRLTLQWKQKDPVRSPEALWLHFDLAASNPSRWRIYKHGRPVSPLNVVSGGNRKLHCAEKLTCDNALERLCILSTDAPLVSVGGRNLYNVEDRVDDPAKGFWFLLCNNRWGTNFPQWFGEDMRFAFDVKLLGVEAAVRANKYR